MKKAILATKVGMTQIFNEDGVLTHPDGVGMPVIGSLLSDPVHSTVPLGVRNTFHGEEVLLFVGLNTAAVQSAHIPAGDSACLVRNLETGECTQVGAGETLDVELRYGEYAALAVARATILSHTPTAHSEWETNSPPTSMGTSENR